VVVESVELDAVWRNAEDAVATVTGTPDGPSVGALPVEGQQPVRRLLAPRLTQSPDGTVTIRTTSHVVRRVNSLPDRLREFRSGRSGMERKRLVF
jgi:hypothetical protein